MCWRYRFLQSSWIFWLRRRGGQTWYLSQVLHSDMYTVHHTHCTDRGGQTWDLSQILHSDMYTVHHTLYGQRRVNVVFIIGTAFWYVHCTPYTVRTEAGKRGIYHRYYIQICTLYTYTLRTEAGKCGIYHRYYIQLCTLYTVSVRTKASKRGITFRYAYNVQCINRVQL